MNLIAAVSPDYTPFWILAAGVIFVIASIVKFRLHPFLGLTLGAILVGLLTPQLPELTKSNGFWSDSEGATHLIQSINWGYGWFRHVGG